MEIGQLEAFERAAREGSFTRAADVLGLTQPSISARIAGLEAELGGPVFTRGGHKLRLTPLGQRFLPYAERALAVLADGAQAAQNFHDGKMGQVALAGLDTMIMRMLPDPLERFRAEYPAVDVTIRLRRTADILESLYDGWATLGLLGAPLFDKGIAIHAHFQEPIRGVVSVDHPLAAQQAEQGHLQLRDIFPHTIFRVAMSTRVTAFVDGLLDNALRRGGGAVVQVPSMMVVRMLILGQGVAFLPQFFVQRHVSRDKLVFLEIEDMPQLYDEPMLVSLRGRKLDRPNLEFVRMVKAQWREMLVFER